MISRKVLLLPQIYKSKSFEDFITENFTVGDDVKSYYHYSNFLLQAILGKVHLVLNCFIENDVILEFNVPQPPPKSGLSWRHNPSLTVGLQKTTFFLGHCEGIGGDR